jgi:hypothetical protein
MHNDFPPRRSERSADRLSIARRREILKRIGRTSLVAGAAASPLAALAGGSGPSWCRHPVDVTKCVHASISGMASIVLSAQASNEVQSKKCSHYSNSSNWPSTCSNGTKAITCNSRFKTAFNCPSGSFDSKGVATGKAGCLLDKTLLDLCTNYSGSNEAHWACALGNANKLALPVTGAPFPYTPAQVVGHYQDGTLRPTAYTFYTTFCEQYA